MKKLALFGFLAMLLFGCGQNKNVQQKVEENPQEIVVLTIDELYEKAPELANKKVLVKGTVMHVCKHGGERCFLMGSNEDMNIRIEAGEKIGAFSQEYMGSELEISGILKVVETEADAHNPGREHGNGEHEEDEDAETEQAHKVIAEAQEAAEVVYFIEGIEAKEL